MNAPTAIYYGLVDPLAYTRRQILAVLALLAVAILLAGLAILTSGADTATSDRTDYGTRRAGAHVEVWQ